MKLVVAEKPSVAQSLAAVLGAKVKKDGYLEGGGWLVSWCVGHLVELAQPEAYGEQYVKWRYADLPILPAHWKYDVAKDKKKQLGVLRHLMEDKRVDAVVCATDAGREGELIFRLVYQQVGCSKPILRLWMRRIAQINRCEQTPLYWMSRPSGTWLLRERDLFIRESSAFHIWQYYKDTRDTILAYTVEITGIEGDAIKGNLYTQDYRAMADYIEKNAFPAATARVLFEGHLAPMKFTYEDYQANRLALQAKHGKEIKLWLEPADSAALDTLLQNVRRSRQNYVPGVFEDHLEKMIAAEKRSVTHFLKETAANAPRPALNKKAKEPPQR